MSQTNPTPVDALPTAPSTAAPSTFATLADAFIVALTPFRTQVNNIATNVYNNAVDCYNNAVAAAASSASASAAANITKWISGTSYTEGDGVWSPADFQSYRRRVTGGGTTDPSADPTNWALIGKSFHNIQDFRLTLETGVPISTADQIAKTTIYCAPYKGNRIALYDGSAWNVRQSAQFSLALGTLSANSPYDVFCYDNAGTPTLEFGAWASDTARATALAYQDGVLVKSGAPTRRYLGTFHTTATTTTEDSAANRYLWNYYHRVARHMKRVEATASWTYTTAALRQANGAAANQLNFVIGVSEDCVAAKLSAIAQSSVANVALISGIGLDSTSAVIDGSLNAQPTAYAATSVTLPTSYFGLVAEGRHYLSWLEQSQASGTTTWYGGGNSIISGEVWA